jgi:hypothetical protein
MNGYENIHLVIAAMWFAYPAAIAFYAIVRRQLDNVAPTNFERKEN